MKWIEALKEFNKDKNEWCIPKKGTEGYEKTKKMMTESKINKKEMDKKEMDKKIREDRNKLKREMRSLIKVGNKKEEEKFEKLWKKNNTIQSSTASNETYVLKKKKIKSPLIYD